MEEEIFATKERQEILDEHGIHWRFDLDLNFVFDSESDERKARKILKNALVL